MLQNSNGHERSYGNTQKSQGCIYGVSSEEILELNKELDYSIDIKAFERGEFVYCGISIEALMRIHKCDIYG